MMLNGCENLTQSEIKEIMYKESRRKQLASEEAKRLGHAYYLFVEGHSFWRGTDDGWEIIAKSDEEAVACAIDDACSICRILIDNVPIPAADDDEAIETYWDYQPTRPFKLMHQGRVVHEYVPKNLR